MFELRVLVFQHLETFLEGAFLDLRDLLDEVVVRLTNLSQELALSILCLSVLSSLQRLLITF